MSLYQPRRADRATKPFTGAKSRYRSSDRIIVSLQVYNPAMDQKPKMKSDITPLCPHHDEPMTLARLVIKIESFESLLQAYACRFPGCNEKYSMGHGYFEAVTGDNIKASRNVKRCIECREHLYLAKRGATAEDTTWLCSNENCPCSAPATQKQE